VTFFKDASVELGLKILHFLNFITSYTSKITNHFTLPKKCRHNLIFEMLAYMLYVIGKIENESKRGLHEKENKQISDLGNSKPTSL